MVLVVFLSALAFCRIPIISFVPPWLSHVSGRPGGRANGDEQIWDLKFHVAFLPEGLLPSRAGVPNSVGGTPWGAAAPKDLDLPHCGGDS